MYTAVQKRLLNSRTPHQLSSIGGADVDQKKVRSNNQIFSSELNFSTEKNIYFIWNFEIYKLINNINIFMTLRNKLFFSLMTFSITQIIAAISWQCYFTNRTL